MAGLINDSSPRKSIYATPRDLSQGHSGNHNFETWVRFAGFYDPVVTSYQLFKSVASPAPIEGCPFEHVRNEKLGDIQDFDPSAQTLLVGEGFRHGGSSVGGDDERTEASVEIIGALLKEQLCRGGSDVDDAVADLKITGTTSRGIGDGVAAVIDDLIWIQHFELCPNDMLHHGSKNCGPPVLALAAFCFFENAAEAGFESGARQPTKECSD